MRWSNTTTVFPGRLCNLSPRIY